MSILRTERYETEVDFDHRAGEHGALASKSHVHLSKGEELHHVRVMKSGKRVMRAKLNTRLLLEPNSPVIIDMDGSDKWTADQVRSLRDLLELLHDRYDFQIQPLNGADGLSWNPGLAGEVHRVLEDWKGWVEPVGAAPKTPDGAQDGTTESTKDAGGTSGGSDSSEAEEEAPKPLQVEFKKTRLKKDGLIGPHTVAQMQIAFGIPEVTGQVLGQPAEYQGLNDALSDDAFVWDSGDGDQTISALQEWLTDQGHFEGESNGQWSTDLSHAIERLAGNKKETTGVVRAKSQAAVTLQREINRLNGYKEAGK